MHCGQAIAPVQESSRYAAPVPVPFYSNPAAVAKKQNRNLAIILTAIAAIIIALIIGAAALLSAKNKAPQANLKSLGTGSAPPLAVKGQKMPKDIFDWLEHLRETEDRRNRLATEQIPQVLASRNVGEVQNDQAAADPNNTDIKAPSIAHAQETANAMKKQWADLLTFFDSVPPPDECIRIRNEYDQTVRETGAEMGDIFDILGAAPENAQDSLSRLNDIMSRDRQNIDQHGANTDQLVSDICAKYNTKKWFDIKRDIGGGSAMQQLLGGGISIPTPGQ